MLLKTLIATIASGVAVALDVGVAPIADAVASSAEGGLVATAAASAAIGGAMQGVGAAAKARSDRSSAQVTARDTLNIALPTTGIALAALTALGPWGALAAMVIPTAISAWEARQ